MPSAQADRRHARREAPWCRGRESRRLSLREASRPGRLAGCAAVRQRYANTGAARIADRNRAVDRVQRGLQHMPELVLILRSHDRHVGQAAQIGQVEDAVMRSPVVSGKPGAVDGEGHRQALQADIMNDLVVGALQKGRIDADDRTHPCGGKPGGEGDGMLLGDPDVEEAVRIDRLEFGRARCRSASPP